MAVALDWGLIVPVIKNADDLSLSGITRALNDVAARARAKKLIARRSAGRNVYHHESGRLRVAHGDADHQPAAGRDPRRGRDREASEGLPGVDGEDTIAIRTCAYFSISFDHRIIDGAVADQFLAFVKKTIETFPETGL